MKDESAHEIAQAAASLTRDARANILYAIYQGLPPASQAAMIKRARELVAHSEGIGVAGVKS